MSYKRVSSPKLDGRRLPAISQTDSSRPSTPTIHHSWPVAGRPWKRSPAKLGIIRSPICQSARLASAALPATSPWDRVAEVPTPSLAQLVNPFVRAGWRRRGAAASSPARGNNTSTEALARFANLHFYEIRSITSQRNHSHAPVG
jgi:hypothetical protein